ncbi:MAG: glycosyltransferase [Streptococcaceae bacterium]|jgi:glycosyltransferase involved in cell wall biosynthesis|nr:glycosyltransferase [Streptococcaceae bacterium]
MREKLISIIVPVYNAEKFIRQTAESILRQTYKNLELLLVDDGSKDLSGRICDELAAADARVRVFHCRNGGISSAQNKGLDEARGEYLTFCDNDDLYHPQYLEILSEALEGAQADMAKGRWERPGLSELSHLTYETYVVQIAQKMTAFTDAYRQYQTVFPKLLRRLKHQEAYYFNESNWCKLYKRELFDGIRFPEGRFAQDVAVVGPILSRVNKVVDVDLVLYYWLQHADSVTHHRDNFKFLDDNIQAGIENFDLAVKLGIPPYRTYYLLAGVIHDIKKLSGNHAAYIRNIKKNYLRKMPHRLHAVFLYRLRLFENVFYDRIYHRKK